MWLPCAVVQVLLCALLTSLQSSHVRVSSYSEFVHNTIAHATNKGVVSDALTHMLLLPRALSQFVHNSTRAPLCLPFPGMLRNPDCTLAHSAQGYLYGARFLSLPARSDKNWQLPVKSEASRSGQEWNKHNAPSSSVTPVDCKICSS